MQDEVIVRKKEELESAVNAKTKRIIVKGDLAEKLNTAVKIKKYSKLTIAILATSLAGIPFTGGLSAVAFAPVAALTGLEIGLILAVFFIGLSLVLLIAKDYKTVKMRGKKGDLEAEMELERV